MLEYSDVLEKWKHKNITTVEDLDTVLYESCHF